METGSDFVDVLTNCLNAPLGAIASAANDNTFSQLQDSLSLLRPSVFAIPKSDVLPAPADLEYVNMTLTPETTVVAGSMIVDGDPECGPFSLVGTGSANWSRGAAFLTSAGSSSSSSAHLGFELTMEEPQAGVTYMLGIAPEEMMSIQQLSQQNIFNTCGYYLQPNTAPNWHLYSEAGDVSTPCLGLKHRGTKVAPGDRVSMRFSPKPSPKLEFRIRDEPWAEATFKRPIKPGTRYCAVLLMCTAGKTVTVESCAAATQGMENKFHPMAKFVITNALEVSESSALKALQITQAAGMEMKDLQVTSMVVRPRHVQRMLQRAFSGQGDILTYAFEEDVAGEGAAAPQGSCSSSERSYVVPR